MLKERDETVKRFIIGIDALFLTVAFFLTFALRQNFRLFYRIDLIPGPQLVAEMTASFSDYLVVLFVIVPLWCSVFYLNGMYASFRTKTIGEVTLILARSFLAAALIFGAVAFLFKLEFISRAFFILFLGISFALIFAEKTAIIIMIHYLRTRGYNYRNILIVGTGKRALQFIEKIKRHPEWGFKIIGIADYERERLGMNLGGFDVTIALEDLPELIHATPIDQVVFIVPRSQLDRIENYLYVCETEGIKATVAADLFDLKISRLQQTSLEEIPLITFETTPAEEWQLLVKRAGDIILSGIGLVVLSPLFLVVALLIKVTSPGPVFYLQKRLGRNGRKFIFYKFRSMYQGAHEKISELIAQNEMAGPVFKIRNDPRVTPLGRILRKFSIDELPQLVNVFIGDMSLVGPRPPLPKEVAQYQPWQRRRLSMRPGITCIWQISGRNTIGFDEWMKMDLEYIDTWSLWLDVKILMKTVPVVIFGIGAY